MATVAETPKVKEKLARERLTEKRLEALTVKAGNRYSYLDEKRAALEAWGKLWAGK